MECVMCLPVKASEAINGLQHNVPTINAIMKSGNGSIRVQIILFMKLGKGPSVTLLPHALICMFTCTSKLSITTTNTHTHTHTQWVNYCG